VTIATYRTVLCDGDSCNEESDAGHSAREARAIAKRAGWTRQKDIDGSFRDLCPRCSAEGTADHA
jgi:hypothetical protein